jgi:hypothetical protein
MKNKMRTTDRERERRAEHEMLKIREEKREEEGEQE